MIRMAFRKKQFRTFYLPLLVVGFLAQAALSQPVLLQIRPHIGDTLRMHLSQTVEMAGSTRRGGRDSSTGSMTTSIEVYTRAIAEQWTSGGTLMQSITDSVAMTPASLASLNDLKRRTMQSKRVWVRVSTDGAMEIVDGDDANSELRHIFGEMPAVLARGPVAVGEKWTREMQIPLSGDERGSGHAGIGSRHLPTGFAGEKWRRRLHLDARHDVAHQRSGRASSGGWLRNLRRAIRYHPN